MGFFDSIFGGSKSSGSAKTTTNQDVESTAVSSKAGASSTQTGTTGAQTGTSATQQQQTTQNLSPEVQALITSLIGSTAEAGGGGGASADEARTVAQQLLQRAGQTQEFVDTRKAAVLSEAERKGQQQVNAVQTQTARASGSTFNTLAQQAGQQAQNELNIDLASLKACKASELQLNQYETTNPTRILNLENQL